MEVAAAVDAMLALAAAPARNDRVLAMRGAFEARTGSFSPRESFFEARSAAFWDDALTRGAFGRELGELAADARAWVEPFARAHRGLFEVARPLGGRDEVARPLGGPFLLVDVWSGAEFVAAPSTAGLADALASAAGLVDARVVGAGSIAGAGIVVLPGAVFHHADAAVPTLALLPEARARGMTTHEALDALLRMDHALRTLSRVKPAFAYRKEALG